MPSFKLLILLFATALVASFAWEMAQAPWFANLAGMPFLAHAPVCLAASVGDVVLLAATYAVAALFARDAQWIFRPRAGSVAVWLALGLAVTAAIERSALASGRWRYSASMPTVAGVGLLPLAQWTVVPLLLVAIALYTTRRVRRRATPPLLAGSECRKPKR